MFPNNPYTNQWFIDNHGLAETLKNQVKEKEKLIEKLREEVRVTAHEADILSRVTEVFHGIALCEYAMGKMHSFTPADYSIERIGEAYAIAQDDGTWSVNLTTKGAPGYGSRNVAHLGFGWSEQAAIDAAKMWVATGVNYKSYTEYCCRRDGVQLPFEKVEWRYESLLRDRSVRYEAVMLDGAHLFADSDMWSVQFIHGSAKQSISTYLGLEANKRIAYDTYVALHDCVKSLVQSP